MSSCPRLASAAVRSLTSRCVAPAFAALLLIASTSSLAETIASTAAAWDPSGPSIGREEGRQVRDWYARAENRDAASPGSPKTGMSVRIRRQIDLDRALPLEAKPWASALPAELESRLPVLPAGYQRVLIARDVFLVETSSADPFASPNKVRGVLRRVLPQ